MKKSTIALACVITVMALIVGVGIGIRTGVTDNVSIEINIQNKIEICKGKREKIKYEIINEDVIIEAKSNNKELLEINEISDKSIVITGKEKGNAMIMVLVSFKDEKVERSIEVRITEARNEEIKIENERNIRLENNKIYIIDKEKQSLFSIKIKRMGMSFEETELKVTFDKDIEQEIKGNKVTIFPKENCRMVIEMITLEHIVIKEYEIIVERTCSTFLL